MSTPIHLPRGAFVFDASAAITKLKATVEGKFQETGKAACKKGVEATSNLLERRILENIGYTDHSLDDLAEMGHPYARGGFGATEVNAKGKSSYARASSRGKIAGHPPHVVHSQSHLHGQGEVWGTTGGPQKLFEWWWEEDTDKTVSSAVGIKESEAAHVRMVVYGTRRMLSRDFLTATLLETWDELLQEFESASGLKKKY